MSDALCRSTGLMQFMCPSPKDSSHPVSGRYGRRQSSRSTVTDMTGLLEGVDQHTQLAGHNRLELLLFRLNGDQRFAINVFKVQEVMHCPELTRVPGAHPMVCGLATIRDKTIAVIDLNKAIGFEPLEAGTGFLIVAEFNRAVQGFLVNGVDRIINVNWKDIQPPPDGTGVNSYLTSVIHTEEWLVGVIDVERIFAEVVEVNTSVSAKHTDRKQESSRRLILVADDSAVARKQVKRTFDQMAVECVMACNGKEAWDMLLNWAQNDPDKLEELAMIISDIEMPMMDGYTLTTEIKRDPRFHKLFVLLHSSLSGVFNEAIVKRVGADAFVAKFDSNELAKIYLQQSLSPSEKIAAH